MYDLYLVTGATGNLGSMIVKKLQNSGRRVRALILPGDPLEKDLPIDTERFYGSVDNRASLEGFFSGDLSCACLIHCAGIITIASKPPANLAAVNIGGVKNLTELCIEKKIARFVYVSSVHAIPEKRSGEITETDFFARGRIRGNYAKSKFAATNIVLDASKRGLNAGVVFPSGILSPFDKGRGNISSTILSYCRGKLPAAVRGGYDFIDVRDAADGIIACCDKGASGAAYILSGHYAAIEDILNYIRPLVNGKRLCALPLWLVKIVSLFFELSGLLKKRPLFLTPYSVHVLGSNARFSSKKAELELGFHARSIHSTLDDMILSFKLQELI